MNGSAMSVARVLLVAVVLYMIAKAIQAAFA